MKQITKKTAPQNLAFQAWRKKAAALASHLNETDRMCVQLEKQRIAMMTAFPLLILPELAASPDGLWRRNAQLANEIIGHAIAIHEGLSTGQMAA